MSTPIIRTLRASGTDYGMKAADYIEELEAAAKKTTCAKQQCQRCKFWSAWPQQPNPQFIIGDCRRHAPQIFKAESDLMRAKEKFLTKFPSTPHDSFCGAFQEASDA